MSLQVREFVNVLADLCEVRDLKVTVKQSAKGGMLAGISAFIGGLLFGPPGLAIGGTVGGVAASTYCSNFKPVATVLRNMTENEKERLYNTVLNALTRIEPLDLITLCSVILSKQNLQEIALNEVKNFLSSEMKLMIT